MRSSLLDRCQCKSFRPILQQFIRSVLIQVPYSYSLVVYQIVASASPFVVFFSSLLGRFQSKSLIPILQQFIRSLLVQVPSSFIFTRKIGDQLANFPHTKSLRLPIQKKRILKPSEELSRGSPQANLISYDLTYKQTNRD